MFVSLLGKNFERENGHQIKRKKNQNKFTGRCTGRKRDTNEIQFNSEVKTSISRKKWCSGAILWARTRTARPCQLENTLCPFNSFYPTTSLPRSKDRAVLKDMCGTLSKLPLVNFFFTSFRLTRRFYSKEVLHHQWMGGLMNGQTDGPMDGQTLL